MQQTEYEAVIIGGSYAGLAAAMSLGRALRKVLIIDSGTPCNRFSPYAHNFISRDGVSPQEIAAIAKEEVLRYETVSWEQGRVSAVSGTDRNFKVATASGKVFTAGKLIFAAGLKDTLPAIPGFAECWGISIIHCPYCHGYERKGAKTGVLLNGSPAYEMAKMINQWTSDLRVFTNGPSQLSEIQTQLLQAHQIQVEEKEIAEVVQEAGAIKQLRFRDDSVYDLEALYARVPFVQQSDIPQQLGCKFSEDGLLEVDFYKCTSVDGIYAAGDNSSPLRSLSAAVAAGNTAGAMLNLELIQDRFKTTAQSLA